MVSATTRDVTNYGDFKLFKSIGPLIKDYRRLHTLSQETLAAGIHISVRQLQRWERDQRPILIENLHDLSEATGIPMHVCVALNADQPIWYSLEQRRFAYSAIEAQFLFHELFRHRQQANAGDVLKIDRITTDKHISLILACHRDIYGTEESLRRDVIKTACRILPDLNRIAFDSWGHYVGHNICLPIKLDVYRELTQQKVLEDYLTADKISDIVSLHEGCFFYYSSFAPSLDVVHQIFVDLTGCLNKIEDKENYLVAVHTALVEAKKFFNHLGMRIVEGYARGQDKAQPKMYEMELDALMRPLGPCGWILEKQSGKEELLIGKADRNAEVATVDAMPEALSVDRQAGASFLITETRDQRRNKPSVRGQEIGPCPNPHCSHHGVVVAGSIVANGTYRSKAGNVCPRFLCKNCRKSFSGKADSLFPGLRSPESRVLAAFNLLVSGMPLRRVAATLGIELRTVRHWLNFAAARRDRLDGVLLKALDVSTVELDKLWASVNKGTLRQRAILWQKSQRRS